MQAAGGRVWGLDGTWGARSSQPSADGPHNEVEVSIEFRDRATPIKGGGYAGPACLLEMGGGSVPPVYKQKTNKK